MPKKPAPEPVPERPLEPFFFPEHGLSVAARDLEEAQATLARLLADRS